MIFKFLKFVATKKVRQQIFFTPLFCCCFWVRDSGWVKIRIRDKHPGSATLCASRHCVANTSAFQQYLAGNSYSLLQQLALFEVYVTLLQALCIRLICSIFFRRKPTISLYYKKNLDNYRALLLLKDKLWGIFRPRGGHIFSLLKKLSSSNDVFFTLVGTF
jgi:hypothetical protein